MKKILFFASALAGLFLTASCQQESLEPEVSGNVVSYTIQVPGVLSTKAIGENVSAVNELVYEVYRTEATAADDHSQTETKLFSKTAVITNGTATVDFELVNNQNFRVLFWAHVNTETTPSVYTTTDLKNVTLSQSLTANAESYAAFAGSDFIKYGDNIKGRTVTLVRPIAQLNIATAPGSLDIEGQKTVKMTTTGVTVTGLSTSYNVAESLAGKVSTTAFTYSPAAVSGLSEQKLSVNGTAYDYVAMNYVGFAEQSGSNVEVSYTINTENVGTISNTIKNVPVKANYRTNIVGNLITSMSDYTITLDKEWAKTEFVGPEFVMEPQKDNEGNYVITNKYELLWLAQQVNSGAKDFDGETVQLAADIDLDNEPWTPIGYSTSVTFRGMFEGVAVTKSSTEYPTISNLFIENGNCSGFFGLLCNGGKIRNINFKDVNIRGERQLGAVVGQVYGNLEQPTIENVTVDNAVITAVPAFDGTEYDNGDKVGGIAGLIGQNAYIKGCTVKNSTFTAYRDMGGIVGCTQNGYPCNLTGNTTNNIKFVVTSYYNPYNKKTPHGATDAIRGGTRANENDVIVDNTCSEISEVIIVKDQVSLQNAINAAGVGETYIQFASGSDINGNVTIVQKKGVKISIDGAGNEYDGVIKIHGNSNYYEDAALTIKNVAFKSATTYLNSDGDPFFNFIEALENGSERYSSNITVEECSFTHTGETANIAVGLQIKASRNAKVLNCTATKMHSLIQAQSCGTNVEVKGCTITEGKNGVAFKQVKNALVEGTTINVSAYGIRFDGNTDNYGITVRGNKVTAMQPFIVRKMTGKNNTITLEGENTFDPPKNFDFEYQIVITNGSDDVKYAKPTGTYTLTGAEDYYVYEGYTVAKVGDAEYDTMAEAIENWKNNSTLTLHRRVKLSNVITLKSTEYHVLNLGTFTMTAAKNKNAIEISNEGRSKASYALDIKADATTPGGITATSKAVVKTTGKSGVQDRPIIRFYNGVFNASSIVQHSGSNGTNSPQFNFYDGVYNGSISTNRTICIFEGGTFNGKFYMSVDSSSYARIGGGRYKELKNLYGSALNANKFTIGSAKGVFDRGVYVDDEGYIVVGGPVITEFGDKFKAKSTNLDAYGTGTFGSYLLYSSAAANGLYYTNAEMAIAKHGEANVVLP